MPKRLKNLRIKEISTVDRGAGNGGVDIVLMKRDFSADERRSAADSGAALPDGSFPIKNEQDLKNAIQAVGRAKNPARAKSHIKSRAAALGATSLLPDSWSKRDGIEDKALSLVIGKIIDDEEAPTAALITLFKQFRDHADDSQETQMTEAEIAKLVADSVAKALKDAGLPFQKMTAEHSAYHSNLDGDEAKKFGSMDHDERDKYMKEHPHSDDEEGEGEDGDEPESKDKAEKVLAKIFGAPAAAAMILKSEEAKSKKKKKIEEDDDADDHQNAAKRAIDPVAKALKNENEALKKRMAVLEEDKQLTEYSKRAVDIGLVAADGELLLKVHRGDPAAIAKLEDKFKALRAQVEKGGLFLEIGGNNGTAATAHDELVAKGAEIRKADATGKMTVEQAYTKAMEMYPDIASRERQERMNKIQKVAS